MTTQIEAMKLALGALELGDDASLAERDTAITALREALAEQPAQQEPVAWGNLANWCLDSDRVLITDKDDAAKYHRDVYDLTPLYTTPQAQTAQPLTDEMVTAAARALNKRQAEACGVDKNDHWKFYGDDIKEDARAVLEAAHGITKGNT